MRVHRVLGWLVLSVSVSVCAVGAEKKPALPKDLPSYGPLVPFRAPRVEAKKLPNGLTLWLASRPGFPKVALALAVRGGFAEDPKDRPALSQLLVATVDQGTKTRTAKQIAEEFQAEGGDLSGSADAEGVVLSIEVLATKLGRALTVLADVTGNATFPESEVALAKRNAADSLREQEAQPSFQANRALARAFFGSHPYSIVAPTEESIAKTAPEELRREYSRRFRPDQALLVAVGDFDPQAMTSEVEKLFGPWASPAGSAVAPVGQPPRQNPHAVYFVARPGSVQTTLALAAFGPDERDPAYAAAQVANAIYGGMFGSRLINNIREDKGYTYSPGALLRVRSRAVVLETRADVRNDVTGASLNEVEYELNRMGTTAPEPEELTHAQRYLIGVRAISLQSQSAVARRLAGLWIRGLPPEEIQRESERIEKVTVADIEKAGAKYFPFARQTIVAVGEPKVIEEQLAPFGMEIKPAP